MAYGGSGLGRGADGKVYFVPKTMPGDRIQLQVSDDRQRFAFGTLQGHLSANPLRRPSPCPVSETCGGCQWLAADESLQRSWKSEFVKTALAKITPPVTLPADWAVQAAPSQLGYRNRLLLRGRITTTGKVVVGFFAPGSRNLVAVQTCALGSPELRQVITFLSELVLAPRATTLAFRLELQSFPLVGTEKSRRENSPTEDVPARHGPLVTVLGTAVDPGTESNSTQDNDCLEGPASERERRTLPAEKELPAQALEPLLTALRQHPDVLWAGCRPKALPTSQTPTSSREAVTEGASAKAEPLPRLPHDRFRGMDGQWHTLWTEPGAFQQVNLTMNTRLRQALFAHISRLQAQGILPEHLRTVWDLYCGSGNLSLGIVAEKLIGIEQSPASILLAQHSATQSGLGHEYYAGDCRRFVETGTVQSGRPRKSGKKPEKQARQADGIKAERSNSAQSAAGKQPSGPDLVLLDPPRTGLEASIIQCLGTTK